MSKETILNLMTMIGIIVGIGFLLILFINIYIIKKRKKQGKSIKMAVVLLACLLSPILIGLSALIYFKTIDYLNFSFKQKIIKSDMVGVWELTSKSQEKLYEHGVGVGYINSYFIIYNNGKIKYKNIHNKESISVWRIEKDKYFKIINFDDLLIEKNNKFYLHMYDWWNNISFDYEKVRDSDVATLKHKQQIYISKGD
jgi:hypothetical protein